LKASNKGGLVLKKTKDDESNIKLVINQLSKYQEPIKYKDSLADGVFPTLLYFEGFNMVFDYRLLSETSDTGATFADEKGANIKGFDLKTFRRNITVEFISTSNKLIDFF